MKNNRASDEPHYFRSKDAADNYIEAKRKEFLWLLHQAGNDKLSEKKRAKYRAKLDRWLDNHPTLAKEIYKAAEGVLERLMTD